MSVYYVGGISYSSDELYHHGIKGQKWGIRRFQNPDGSYTEAGLKRYRKADARADLGYTRFQSLDKVQKGFVDRYRSDVKGYMSNTKEKKKVDSKVLMTKNAKERRKNEYEREAKAYLSRSETAKKMNQYYNTLFSFDKKSLVGQYNSQLLRNGREAANEYISREMLRRKVSSDRQKDIWDRT